MKCKECGTEMVNGQAIDCGHSEDEQNSVRTLILN